MERHLPTALESTEREGKIYYQTVTSRSNDYDSENPWISDGLHSSSSIRSRGEGSGQEGEWYIGMPVCNDDILVCIGLLVVNIKAQMRDGEPRGSKRHYYTMLGFASAGRDCDPVTEREREKFFTRQPPIGEKDDYDGENSWISEGIPSSSRRSSIGEGRGDGGRGREKARSTLE